MVFYFLINKCIHVSSCLVEIDVLFKFLCCCFYFFFFSLLIEWRIKWHPHELLMAYCCISHEMSFFKICRWPFFPIGRRKSLVRCFIWIFKFCQSNFILAKWIFILNMDTDRDTIFPFCVKCLFSVQFIQES